MNYLGNFIQKKIKEKKISERELAKICGISHSYVNQIVSGINSKTKKEINPTVRTLEKLSKGLSISIENLQKIVLGVPEDLLSDRTTYSYRTRFLNNLEKTSKTQGIPVGSRSNRLIPWDIWNEIKQAQLFLDSIDLDPSEFSESNWNDLIKDINLLIRIHSEKKK